MSFNQYYASGNRLTTPITTCCKVKLSMHALNYTHFTNSVYIQDFYVIAYMQCANLKLGGGGGGGSGPSSYFCGHALKVILYNVVVYLTSCWSVGGSRVHVRIYT